MAHELRKEEEERRARARAAEPLSGFSKQMQSTFARALLPQRSNRVAVDASELDDRHTDDEAPVEKVAPDLFRTRAAAPSLFRGTAERETAEGILGKAISGALAGGMPNSGGPRRRVAKAATVTGSTVDGDPLAKATAEGIDIAWGVKLAKRHLGASA